MRSAEVSPGVREVVHDAGHYVVRHVVLDAGDGGRDGGVWLWDTGLPGQATRWLESSGSSVVRGILISHADADHFGDAGSLSSGGVRLYAHEADRRWIEDTNAIVRERYDCARGRFGFGYSQAALRDLGSACGTKVTVSSAVAEGQLVALSEEGGRAWRVLHLPGHSPGHIGLWNPDSGVLLCGDAVLGDGVVGSDGVTRVMPPTHQYIAGYLRTIERLRALPVRLAITGHWPLLNGDSFHALLDLSEATVRRDLDFVVKLVSKGPLRFEELVSTWNERMRRWPREADVHAFYCLLGTVEYLEAGGLVQVEQEMIVRVK